MRIKYKYSFAECPATCPNCGTDAGLTPQIDVEGESVRVRFECPRCRFIWTEEYYFSVWYPGIWKGE